MISVLHIGPERIIRMQMHCRGDHVLRKITSIASDKKRDFCAHGHGSKAKDALPVEIPNHIVREVQSGSSIPAEGKQEEGANIYDTTCIVRQPFNMG